METAILAVVRASRPTFRSADDKLAFAIHAFLLAEGYKLVAAGAAAEDDSADFCSSREEVEPAGWNELDSLYAFRYQDTEGRRPPLYVKCLAAGDRLLLHWASKSGGDEEVQALELAAADYTTDAGSPPGCYKQLGELIAKLRQSMRSVLSRGPAKLTSGGAGDAAANAQQAGQSSRSGRPAERGEDPLREPAGVSGVGYRPPGIPAGIGIDDVVPPGVRPPGYGGHPGLPGLMQPGPLHGGGGMHVGPGDPIFGPGRMGGGVGGPPGTGSLPPGARWDPIAPPGMRGFGPDDFQREPGRPHPDMAQPGPGRGTDWDRMFG